MKRVLKIISSLFTRIKEVIMPIYKGSTKQGTIYVGGTKIGKVYKGSTLVYSGGEKQILLYSIGSNLYTLGYPSPNSNLVCTSATNLNENRYLTAISGTIGNTGSSITINKGKSATYSGTSFTDSNGNLFYIYQYSGNMGYDYAFVSPKQKLGDYIPTSYLSLISIKISANGSIGTYNYSNPAFNSNISITIGNPLSTPIYIHRK